MAGFRKAKAKQAALKLGIYGAPGRGKTFTALLLGEGLAKLTGKRVAMVDTEHGSDFYCQSVPDRTVHPEAFDFDCLYTKSLSEVLTSVKQLRPADYGVIIIDSITHLWESARAAYTGPLTSAGQPPFHAWNKIKRPYKDLMTYLLSSPMHVIICGREKTVYEEDEDTGELKQSGKAMRAESETPYEPHILIRIENERDRDGKQTIWAFAEKDRTGILAGRHIQIYPSQHSTFDLLAKPLLPLLGGTQAKMQTEAEVASKDAEAFSTDEAARIAESERMLSKFTARLELCEDVAALKAIGKEITPEIKEQMTPSDVAELRARYLAAEKRIGGKE